MWIPTISRKFRHKFQHWPWNCQILYLSHSAVCPQNQLLGNWPDTFSTSYLSPLLHGGVRLVNEPASRHSSTKHTPQVNRLHSWTWPAKKGLQRSAASCDRWWKWTSKSMDLHCLTAFLRCVDAHLGTTRKSKGFLSLSHVRLHPCVRSPACVAMSSNSSHWLAVQTLRLRFTWEN